MQAATFKISQEPVDIPLGVLRFYKCEIVDNLAFMYTNEQPTYFASYKFDERWQLVDRQEYLSEEANIRLPLKSHLYFACSRLWMYNFKTRFGNYESNLAQLKQIRCIERSNTAPHSLSLEPLPQAIGSLEKRTNVENIKKKVGPRKKKNSLFQSFSASLATFMAN